jgi:type IV secretory pathway TraG/TraD family ATPase VirD4
VPAGLEQSVLVLGPPRSGKTSSIVIPCVLDAPAAVVSTSTKPDVLYPTLSFRSYIGTCYVFDPSATVPIPQGAVPLRWSPVTGCARFEAAVSMAHSLSSAARPLASLSEAAHWVERAGALLAPLLHAAALGGRDMRAVCLWVLGKDLREPAEILAVRAGDMPRVILSGVDGTEERERSGIFSTAASLLAAYNSEAALEAACAPNFDPQAFVESSDTVYICAPAHAQDQLAPLVVALLEQIRAATYARPRDAAPVVFALDEVAGMAPIPTLPSIAAEGGGQGLVTLACLQDLSQARVRWGEAAEGFFSLFGTKLVFPGIGDPRTLELVSLLAGEEQVPVQSFTRPVSYLLAPKGAHPTVTYSTQWRGRLPPDAVARGADGQALVLDKFGWCFRRVPPWWAMPDVRSLVPARA